MLGEEGKKWVELGFKKGYTRAFLTGKLVESKVSQDKIIDMIKYYDELSRKKEEEMKQEREKNKGDEEMFKAEYAEYLEAKSKGKLSFSQRRKFKDCIKFEKKVNALLVSYKDFLVKIKLYIKELAKKLGVDSSSVNRELDGLRLDLVEKIIDSKVILDVEHPKKKIEATLDNLRDLTVDELIDLMEDGIDMLELFINGKEDKK